METKDIAHLIKNEQYRIYNRELSHYLGLKESIYLMYLIDCDRLINANNVGEPFFKQQKFISLETTITNQVQQKINKKLKEMGIIDIVKQGHPAMNYFVINYVRFLEVLNLAKESFTKLRAILVGGTNQNECTSTIKKNEHINNNKEIINSNNNSKELLSVEPKDSTVKKPSGIAKLYEITSEYFKDKGCDDLVIELNAYLRTYIGCRRLPSEEKWNTMLNTLNEYSSIELPGALGKKFLKSNALAIVEKAANGKDGIPFTQFDNIFSVNTIAVQEVPTAPSLPKATKSDITIQIDENDAALQAALYSGALNNSGMKGY